MFDIKFMDIEIYEFVRKMLLNGEMSGILTFLNEFIWFCLIIIDSK